MTNSGFGDISNLPILREMPEDIVGYVPPWAWREEGYLDLGYHYHSRMNRTATMMVFRNGEKYTMVYEGNLLVYDRSL